MALTTCPLLGTVFIHHDASRPPQAGQPQSRPLKYASGPAPLILVPQPSDDPNDPLVRRTSYLRLRGR